VVPNSSRIEAIKCFGEIASLFTPTESESKMLSNANTTNPADLPENRPNLEKLCLYFCVFIQKIVEITKNRDLVDEFKSVQGTKNQSAFENFSR
jgi:hypothetical protein